MSREAELEGVVRKLECSEKQCNEGRMEMVQLRADFKNTENQKNSLDSKVCISVFSQNYIYCSRMCNNYYTVKYSEYCLPIAE